MDKACFAECARESSKNQAAEFFDLVRKLILNVGGAILLMIGNKLETNDWRKQLTESADIQLESKSLEVIAEALSNFLIYVTADYKLFNVPADVECKVFWTLSPDQFQGHFTTVPNLAQAGLLIFVRSLRELQSNLDSFHWNQASVKVRGTACRGIVGSAVRFVYAVTHCCERACWQIASTGSFQIVAVAPQ